MESCFKCGISENKSLLYDAITGEGIQKICRRCSHHEEVPIMQTKDALELKEFERKQDTYERISRVSGVGNGKKLNSRSLALESQETSLRNLVEKNVCKGLSKQAKPREDLVKNYHWLIKRYRRLKHLTTKQFAEALREPEKLIVLAEQGVVPEGYDFIKKVEKLLGIALIKQEVYEELKRREQREFSVEKQTDLTIADLKEIKEKTKGKGFFGFFSSKKKVPESNSEEVIEIEEEESDKDFVKPNASAKRDLTKKEMEDLIFGKKH